MERRKVCRYFQKGACRKDNCPFVHIKQNRKECAFYMEGNCRKGNSCHFYHPPREEEKLANLKEELKAKTNNRKVEQKKQQSQSEGEFQEPVKQEKVQVHNQQQTQIYLQQIEEVRGPKIQEQIKEEAIEQKKDELKEKMEKISFLLGLNQNSESDDESEEIEQTKAEQIQFVKTYLKKFADFSKTADFKALVAKNEDKYFKGQKYLALITNIIDPYEKQYFQIIRKFTDSFSVIGQNPKHYSVSIRPLLYDKQIVLHFDLVEDTLQIEIDARQYPQKRAVLSILNQSIPQQYKQKFVQLLNRIHYKKSIFQTLKFVQNNFQKIYEQSKFRLENQYYSKKQIERKLKQVKNESNPTAEDKQKVKKTRKPKKQNDYENPFVNVIKYKENERVDTHGFNYELTVQSIILQNCEYVVVQKLLTYIECVCDKKIMYILDLSNDRSLTVGVKLQCKKCQNILILGLEREVVQLRREVLGRVGVNNGHLIDIGGIGFKIGCICNNQISKGKMFLPGERINANCHNCFHAMTISYMGLKLYNPTLKSAQIRTDRQLPNKGSCKHMKLSYRWFRYGCCGRCYGCDDCHIIESVAVHEKIKGITMLCGFCSRQQLVSNECLYCHKILVKGVEKTGHWQGGQGCRDQNALSRKDAKKYTGLTKKK